MSSPTLPSATPTHIFNPWQELPWWQRGRIPVSPPPPGTTSNFTNPESKVHWNILTQSVCITIATVLMILRLYTKIFILRVPGWEDWTALLGYIGFLALSGLLISVDFHGAGKHVWDVLGDDFVVWLKVMYIDEVLYGPVIFTIKLSILLLYLRIFQPVRGTYVAFHLLLWGNLLFYAAGVFVEIFQCDPIRKIWYPEWPGKCVDQRAVQLASAGFNLGSDVAVLVLPILAVWDLNTTKERKVGLFVIFGFGVGGCIASCVRLIMVTHRNWQDDVTWNLYSLNLLTTAELTCAIICSCLPAIPAFFRSLPKIRISIRMTGRSMDRSEHSGSQSYSLGLSEGSKGKPVPPHNTRSSANLGGRLYGREKWEEINDLEYQSTEVSYKGARDPYMGERKAPRNPAAEENHVMKELPRARYEGGMI